MRRRDLHFYATIKPRVTPHLTTIHFLFFCLVNFSLLLLITRIFFCLESKCSKKGSSGNFAIMTSVSSTSHNPIVTSHRNDNIKFLSTKLVIKLATRKSNKIASMPCEPNVNPTAASNRCAAQSDRKRSTQCCISLNSCKIP